MEFDEYLIELVRSHSELYNMTDRRYSDSVWKETLWKEIGEEMGRPGPECKRRWVSLRDQFRKCVIKKTKSVQATNPRSHGSMRRLWLSCTYTCWSGKQFLT
ncbi:transcription factor Adf-1-like [Schistocerca piceifrons]|uniref:transcription factor Adf-1-like n=1 Tax=Schistocerca piceifrons TaxID=274613 RepID=UPI001F5E6CEC|nr:transcription factor Adf-1-like [Schistocerca piceifrons]